MGRVAAFSSSVTKIQRLKDCIRLFGMPYCDVQTHNSKLDVSKSLPEFSKMPTPEDVSVLKFNSDGEYDQLYQELLDLEEEAAGRNCGQKGCRVGRRDEWGRVRGRARCSSAMKRGL